MSQKPGSSWVAQGKPTPNDPMVRVDDPIETALIAVLRRIRAAVGRLRRMP